MVLPSPPWSRRNLPLLQGPKCSISGGFGMLSRDPTREDCFPAILQVADRQYFAIRLRRRRRHAKRTGTGLRPTERQAAAAGSRPGDSGPDSGRRIVSVPHGYTGELIPRASGRAKRPYLQKLGLFARPRAVSHCGPACKSRHRPAEPCKSRHEPAEPRKSRHEPAERGLSQASRRKAE